MTDHAKARLRKGAAVALCVATAACSDIFSLDIEAPGRIADEDLNNRSAVQGIVAGMSYDISQGLDAALAEAVMAGGELWHGGSYNHGAIPRGMLLDEAGLWDGPFGSMQQGRWVAEQGLKRILEVLGPTDYETSPNVARAYLLAGFANRLLGELQCVSTIDGGPEVPNTEHFERADSLFTRAIEVAMAANQSSIIDAAHGGRASVRAWLGDWTGAVADASVVPAAFEYHAVFSTTPGGIENDLAGETNATNGRREYTVFSTVWVDVPDDPRVPWHPVLNAAGQVVPSQDGETPFYEQDKFEDSDADIRFTHGSEMLVLRAEARLRNNDIPGMVDLLDQARAVYDMDPITAVPGNMAEAWSLLRVERAATLWLEGRRLFDLRRWQEQGGDAADPFAAGRDLCFPISLEERRVNPNL